MLRKTPDEIFTVIRKYEPDRAAEVKALRIVLEANVKSQQEQVKSEENQEQAG